MPGWGEVVWLRRAFPSGEACESRGTREDIASRAASTFSVLVREVPNQRYWCRAFNLLAYHIPLASIYTTGSALGCSSSLLFDSHFPRFPGPWVGAVCERL